ncbi:histidine kinase famiy protein [Ramlibacter tataouinensis]|uniref:histidine kinase n=1 Tax=Ramlibacter tataouinensis (strain ATCC BAA-407 / DSM 14655 / LMG 21543 / TTB310) TaxID=365046 RepID=F5Y2K4_RAMTT|nr:histidine kinase famiy protein [Ramlibacter tataouinensis]AEG92367.1 candidate histidine kinase, hybrid [Ramlibacter tataouinensis TTB310]
MATGRKNNDTDQPQLDTEREGQGAGVPATGNLFFAAVEMTRMPMVVTDPHQPDNPIAFVNDAFLDMTGYEEAEVLGRNCRILQGPETDSETVAEIRTALAEQRAVAVDILNYKADGTPFWNALFIGPIFDSRGRLIHWSSSQMDITRRRMSEQSLRQAQKMEAIGQLTAGLAHDFNNLLQAISGNLELAAHHAAGHPVLESAIERASRAAHKGGCLTQQLLTFARKQRLDPRRVNLNTLVVEFSEMLVRSMGGQVELQLDLHPGLPACVVDPTHLQMALLNVVINARDAMPQGGRATVGTSVVQDARRTDAHPLPAGGCVVLWVADQGRGMTSEVRRRAIEPFFTTKEPGTGLGLAMVHGFVQQSHGRLEIDSAPERGTTVRMIFPVAQDRAAGAAPPAMPAVRTGPDTATILLVEDSEDVRQVADHYLRSLGYQVLAASSGEEALDLLAHAGGVDLLFTDVIMPGGMNGLQLAERVRQRQPGLPVLLTTGYMDELASQGAQLPSMAVLGKPYRRNELAESIRTALGRTPAPAGQEG